MVDLFVKCIVYPPSSSLTTQFLLIPLLQSNPDVVHKSPLDQLQNYLIESLQSADISTVTVIDTLGECRDGDPESPMLPVLGKFVSNIL